MATVPSDVENEMMENSVINNSRNNIVAESDLRSALKGIENRLSELKDEAMQKPAQTDDGDAPELHDEDSRSSLQNLLSGAQKSLPEHILRVVQPVSDEEYFAHLRRNETNDDEDDLEMDEDESQSSEEESDESQDEYDEEEILDKEAQERARRLRAQVREASERVRMLRDSVKEQAVAIATSEVELLVGQQEKVGKPFDAEKFESAFRRIEADETLEKSDKVLEMEQSLAALVASLESIDLNMPDNIKTFQETLETIQESLARQKGGVESLSQTERAIISRENEGLSQDVVVEEETQSETPVPPQQRLASFILDNY